MLQGWEGRRGTYSDRCWECQQRPPECVSEVPFSEDQYEFVRGRVFQAEEDVCAKLVPTTG